MFDRQMPRTGLNTLMGQSVEGEQLVELPAGVHFVTKEWVADCLAQGKLLPEGRYLIDLAQMALLAKLQVLRMHRAFPANSAVAVAMSAEGPDTIPTCHGKGPNVSAGEYVRECQLQDGTQELLHQPCHILL